MDELLYLERRGVGAGQHLKGRAKPRVQLLCLDDDKAPVLMLRYVSVVG